MRVERELKYTFQRHFDLAVLDRVRHICNVDGQYGANIVNSVYFDTPEDSFAMEKAASDYLKTKVRIRWYEDEGEGDSPSHCFLEIKNKTGSRRSKQRFELDFKGDEIQKRIADGSIVRMVREVAARTLPASQSVTLRPGIIVRYTRRRFVEPSSSTRVALDTGIGASDPARNRNTVLLNQSVLEIKGAVEELPHCLRSLVAMDLKKTAFSKYYECYRKITGYRQ